MNLSLLASWINRYQLGGDKLWRHIIDFKHKTQDPNIVSCPDTNSSPFWKGVLWAAKAAKLGFWWKVGCGKQIKLWEDHWFGSCSLAIQFCELYVIANEHNITIVDVWDGCNLKITFRRCVDSRLMLLWYDLVSIGQSLKINDEEDAII